MKKYHYQIVSSFDPTDIHTDSRNFTQLAIDEESEVDFEGFSSQEAAETDGEFRMKEYNLNPEQYYVKILS